MVEDDTVDLLDFLNWPKKSMTVLIAYDTRECRHVAAGANNHIIDGILLIDRINLGLRLVAGEVREIGLVRGFLRGTIGIPKRLIRSPLRSRDDAVARLSGWKRPDKFFSCGKRIHRVHCHIRRIHIGRERKSHHPRRIRLYRQCVVCIRIVLIFTVETLGRAASPRHTDIHIRDASFSDTEVPDILRRKRCNLIFSRRKWRKIHITRERSFDGEVIDILFFYEKKYGKNHCR